jgi:hypothetical protein
LEVYDRMETERSSNTRQDYGILRRQEIEHTSEEVEADE